MEFWKMILLFNTILLSLVLLTSNAESDFFGMPLGCFADNESKRDLPYKSKLPNAADTVETCADQCHKQHSRYAGLQGGSACFCGGSYGAYGSGTCDKFCQLNTTQPCGGVLANNIYDTGQRSPGPPALLEVSNRSETSIQIRWTMPLSPNGIVDLYRIFVKYVETYSDSSILPPLSLTYTNQTTTAELLNLHPGTKYNISVAAHTKDGKGVPISILAWTRVGEPDEPEVPVVIKHDKGKMVVKLKAALNENGPISSYQIVVIDEGGHPAFNTETLYDWDKSQKEGLLYYIAAEFTPDEFNAVYAKTEFVVGDGKTYGKYYNAPLPIGTDVHVSLGIISTLEGETRARYAQAGHEQHGIIVLDVGKDVEDNGEKTSSTVLVLSVAIGVFGFLLILSVVAYFILRRKLGRRKPLDSQELSLQGPMIQVDSGYVHDAFVPEDEEEARVDHYEKLKNQVWNIPRNFLEVEMEDRLGKGVYGDVVKGVVEQRGFPTSATVHVISDRELSTTNKRFMLQDLDVLIRTGVHPNLVVLIGTCESPETLFVVLEYHPATLKDVLLESRCLEHRSHGGEQARFCSLSEAHILETALGVARAMDHLARLKVVHKQLSARSVLMADGIVPKVTGHGISKYEKGDRILDSTRWMAQEVFRSRHYVTKSDVWAFGCLLWELSALGGTPYASIRTSEIGARVMRGLRLPQLQFVGDDLYQLMLQCWQLDLDERPTFEEIALILENLVADAMAHINFRVYDNFHYEPYIAEFEHKY